MHGEPCRKVIDHYSVPVSGLHSLEATAIHLMLATRQMKLVSAYLSPKRLSLESELTTCLREAIPILMASEINAKHKDWNSTQIKGRGSFLHDHATRNSCLIHSLDLPSTVPYMEKSTPEVVHTLVFKDLILPVLLTVLHLARLTCLF
jgi:hypothetical protein